MSKVSVGLRGWRFEEAEIFDEEGEFKPLAEIPEDPRQRLIRLTTLLDKPCDVCYLIHGEEEIKRCNEAAIVYGEPMGEVLLCEPHEREFLYWFQEAGGSEYKGSEELADAFHEWYAAGNSAPEGYGSVEHVDTDPAGVPEPPSPEEMEARLNEGFEPERIDIREYMSDEERAKRDVRKEDAVTDEDLAELNLTADYPTKQ